jgi:hypothetical protein
MTEMASQVPGEGAWPTTIQTLALAGIQLIPLAGGSVAQVVGDALAFKSRRRDLEFFRAVASHLDALSQKVDGLSNEHFPKLIHQPRPIPWKREPIVTQSIPLG